jgi:biopolymer transport protein ExbB/TolQ
VLNLQLWSVALAVIVLLFLGAFVGGRIGILVRVFGTNKRTRIEEEKDALQQAETSIIEQSPQEWAEMHVRLLQSLEDQAAPEEYRQALETIRDAIDRQLERGVWEAGRLRFPDDGNADKNP